MMKDRSIDSATNKMLVKASTEQISTAWDRLDKQHPQCRYGELGVCCHNCNMGPCRINYLGDEPQAGVCGATADTMVARNLLRMIAAGAAAHSDHGRDIAMTLREAVLGNAPDYTIKDAAKLKALADEFGIPQEGRSQEEVAAELTQIAMDEFGISKGSLQLVKRAPQKRQELWEKLGIAPRGIDREIVEIMHRTHIGVDNDYINLILHGLRTSLGDGWGGSMYATELSDVLFGTPQPIKGRSNLGVLKENQVNIVVHGHEPILSDIIVFAAQDPQLVEKAKKMGAKGINICGMCCTGNEILMRHGVPIAGNFLQQELAIITGAVDAMVVDVQCIMPALPRIAACYHTKVISTSPKAKFPGAVHVPFHEHNAMDTAKSILEMAIDNFPKRRTELVNIPSEEVEYMAGFSAEAIIAALGGSLDPLLEAIKDGAIKGIVGLVGCNNPKVKHDYGHVTLARELIKNDVLVVETGCAAIASAKAGLLLPSAAAEAGDGLQKICEALGIPPVLHMGSCVDISRILVVASAIAQALNVDISDLPIAAAAMEWMSEKAVSIGSYAVSSGIYTVLGLPPHILGSKNVTQLLTKDAEGIVGATFAVEENPHHAAELIIKHLEIKRQALGC